MACSECPNEKTFARGLCQGCYNRLRRRGTVERKNVIRTAHCSIEGCEKETLARNLCIFHYRQTQHPLRELWKNLRSRHPGETSESWSLFANFLADVGERPSKRHRMHRIDEARPFSKQNCEWREVAPPANGGGMTKAERAVYFREWHAKDKYGLSAGALAAMIQAQNGLCAMCDQPETQVDKRTGRLKALHIEHDHKTGKVRSLTCARCNAILGWANDDPALLRAAIAYLEKHSAP